jgi:hypothetical protein
VKVVAERVKVLDERVKVFRNQTEEADERVEGVINLVVNEANRP